MFTQYQKNALLSLLKETLKHAEELEVTKSCHDCKHVIHLNGKIKCGQWNAEPPPEVIAAGCEAYVFDPNSPPF